MRLPALVLSLGLLGACADLDAPTAPTAATASAARQGGVPGSIAALEARADALEAQLVASQVLIARLEARLNVHDSTLSVQGGNIEFLDSAVVALQQSDLGIQGHLDQQDATTAVFSEYLTGLSGVDATSGSADDLYASLFVYEPETGTTVTNVAGMLRRAHFKDKLTQEFDETISEQLSAPTSPLGSALTGLSIRIEDNGRFIDDWQSEVAYLRVDGDIQAATTDVIVAYLRGLADEGASEGTPDELYAALFTSDPDTGETVPRIEGLTRRAHSTLVPEADYVQAIEDVLADSTSSLSSALDALSLRIDGTVHFIDDWQSETAYLTTRVDGIEATVDAHSTDLEAIFGALNGTGSSSGTGATAGTGSTAATGSSTADEAPSDPLPGSDSAACQACEADPTWESGDTCLASDGRDLLCGSTGHF